MGYRSLKLEVGVPIVPIEQEPAHYPNIDEREALHDFEESADRVV